MIDLDDISGREFFVGWNGAGDPMFGMTRVERDELVRLARIGRQVEHHCPTLVATLHRMDRLDELLTEHERHLANLTREVAS